MQRCGSSLQGWVVNNRPCYGGQNAKLQKNRVWIFMSSVSVFISGNLNTEYFTCKRRFFVPPPRKMLARLGCLLACFCFPPVFSLGVAAVMPDYHAQNIMRKYTCKQQYTIDLRDMTLLPTRCTEHAATVAMVHQGNDSFKHTRCNSTSSQPGTVHCTFLI